jgi:hypothetical protein
MRMRAFEKWVLVGAAAFALSSSAGLTLAISDERPARLGADEPLLSQIQRGAAFTIQLFPAACEYRVMRELSCTSLYKGYYNRRNNSWVITGKVANGQIVTGTWKNVPDEPGNISLLGLPGTFDEAGNLFLSGKVRGIIKSAWQNAGR